MPGPEGGLAHKKPMLMKRYAVSRLGIVCTVGAIALGIDALKARADELLSSSLASLVQLNLADAKDQKHVEEMEPSVPMKPQKIKITTESDDLIVPVGGMAKFGIRTSAKNPRYQWIFQCDALPGETNNDITISPVTKEKAGWYYCAVSSGNDTEFSPRFQLMSLTTNSGTIFQFIIGAKIPPGLPPGSSGTCPGAYSGYVVFRKTNSPYGWLPASIGTVGAPPPPPWAIRALWPTCSALVFDCGDARKCNPGAYFDIGASHTVHPTHAHRFTGYFPVSSPPSPSVTYELEITGFRP